MGLSSAAGDLSELISRVHIATSGDDYGDEIVLRSGADAAFASWSQEQDHPHPTTKVPSASEVGPTRCVLPDADTFWDIEEAAPEGVDAGCASKLSISLEPHRTKSVQGQSDEEQLVNNVRPFNLHVSFIDQAGRPSSRHAGMTLRARFLFNDTGEAVPQHLNGTPLSGETEKMVKAGEPSCTLRLRAVTNSFEHNRRLFVIHVEALSHDPRPLHISGWSTPVRVVARLPNSKTPPKRTNAASAQVDAGVHWHQASLQLSPHDVYYVEPSQGACYVEEEESMVTDGSSWWLADRQDATLDDTSQAALPEDEHFQPILATEVHCSDATGSFVMQNSVIEELRAQSAMLQRALAQQQMIMCQMRDLRSRPAQPPLSAC